MDELVVDEVVIPIQFKIGGRVKRVGIKVNDVGAVIVNVPRERDLKFAYRFVNEQKLWIKKNYLKHKKAGQQVKKSYNEGDKIIIFGEEVYTLRIFKGARNSYKIDDAKDELRVYLTVRAKLNSVLRKFYREYAREIFEERARFFAAKVGVKFKWVFIKDQGTRWGSCSSEKNLNFNFRVVLAPERVLDYLVIHEVCHLKEMNHSVRFWSLVEMQMPDYKIQSKWLKTNGFILKHFLRDK